MDCLQELHELELSFDGDLAQLGTIIATVEDVVEQMVFAVHAAKKFRLVHESEAANFTEAETLWRVATEVRKVALDQQEARLLDVAMAYHEALQEYPICDRESDKSDSNNKNTHLQLQVRRQLELNFE